MKYLGILCFVIYSSFALADDPEPIPTQLLESFFINNGVAYTSYPYHIGFTKEASRFVFLDHDDPADNKTLGLFFEFTIFQDMTTINNTHLAAGLRGQTEADLIVGEALGRGVGIGQLQVFDGCNGQNGSPFSPLGFFVENWAAANLMPVEPIEEYLEELQATPCQGINMNTLYATYRVDLHVSRKNVYVAIWKKSSYSSYEFLGDSSCTRDSGELCEELLADKNTGNGFIALTSDDEGVPFYVHDIFIAIWDT